VELALVLPLLMLIVVGAMFFGLAWVEKSSLSHIAQEASYAAAIAPDDASRCQAARQAIHQLSGIEHTDCIGTDGLTVTIDPAQPPTVRVELLETLPVPPIVSYATDGQIRATAASVIRQPAPSPSP
jgi:Flp pilus assembly protein TadG